MKKSLRTPRQRLLQSLLTEARKTGGMTQAELAAALGKPQSFVAKYENGERRIDVIEFADITAALGVSGADLLARLAHGEEKSSPKEKNTTSQDE
ncbi:MAG: helix-turn-helix transcriptional regulator [Gluconobacter potus]|uniref:Helix-turn-helix transcriptional regulator n=1 Tax=Gluconobacter potus TaxID=2724927 RepID=A0ABR9YK35_9PROT|nr:MULTISPECIES: helix-turn-helix transcriptional regulator [Gluconobacter]MBF0864321.1 helix-turn-helix transcriptional regulator [Gluconobacter sp. R71656]MBF0867797.1 helix-turn-helix transcriptional regulator [Gluconobacter sp. R75628]MBF0872722.1 helix-turn-helix transcriptional regulator [Gluconobacter sp. R75629]MBF0881968.1 helix-turn-helix transcriptional regulator [Gluconobacter potus]